MHRKNLLSLALVAAALGITVSAALAGPIMLGPTTAPMTPKTLTVPISTSKMVQVQLLNAYRQVREFWLSRALVR
jgi:hypothetical protein